jgi:hypothetical protein
MPSLDKPRPLKLEKKSMTNITEKTLSPKRTHRTDSRANSIHHSKYHFTEFATENLLSPGRDNIVLSRLLNLFKHSKNTGNFQAAVFDAISKN